MNDSQQSEAADATAPAAPEVVHAQPALGGSYTRDPATGALIKAVPAPQPDEQE